MARPHFHLHLPEAPDKADAGKATSAWPAAISAALAQRSGTLRYGEAIALVCRVTGWPVGHVWTRGVSGWRSSGAWFAADAQTTDTQRADTQTAEARTAPTAGSEPDPASDAYRDGYRALREATALTDLGSGRGIVAAVLHLGSCRFLPGLAGLGSPRRLQAAAALKLRGVIGVPVFAGRDIVAVLEFVTAREVEPDGDLAEALLDVAARCCRPTTGRTSSRTARPARPATAMIPVQARPVDVSLPDHLAG